VQTWQLWAAAAAFSAALTAVLIKVAVQGIDAGLAALFRTVTVAMVLALLLLASGQLAWQGLRDLAPLSLGALVLSGLATGVSWYCYNRALQLGPVAGGSDRQAQRGARCLAGGGAAG
jgi:transporter family protein